MPVSIDNLTSDRYPQCSSRGISLSSQPVVQLTGTRPWPLTRSIVLRRHQPTTSQKGLSPLEKSVSPPQQVLELIPEGIGVVYKLKGQWKWRVFARIPGTCPKGLAPHGIPMTNRPLHLDQDYPKHSYRAGPHHEAGMVLAATGGRPLCIADLLSRNFAEPFRVESGALLQSLAMTPPAAQMKFTISFADEYFLISCTGLGLKISV